jgi:hypothetical protein
VLITEHNPDYDRLLIENLDKPHGGGTRLRENSVVYIDRPPFNLKDVKTLLEVRMTSYPECPVTLSHLMRRRKSCSPVKRRYFNMDLGCGRFLELNLISTTGSMLIQIASPRLAYAIGPNLAHLVESVIFAGLLCAILLF